MRDYPEKGISKDAYGGVKGINYEHYIPTSEVMPEITGYSIIIGIILACFFTAANVYLGLKVGLTITAGIPSAILGVGILKALFKRNNLLEANITASMGAVGESVAGSLIFTVPALIIWGMSINFFQAVVLVILGGLLGIFLVTPFRKLLVVEEHGNLIYPEGMAAAEVLVHSSEGGSGFKTILAGIGVGAAYKWLSGGFGLWNESATVYFKSYQGTKFGFETLASLLGLGFIVGTKTASLLFGGSLIAWLALIPLIKYIGASAVTVIEPATTLISSMTSDEIWQQYIRYIGAGGVVAGGLISLITSLPSILKSFKAAIIGLKKKANFNGNTLRSDIEVPMFWVLIVIISVFLMTWLLPVVCSNIVGAVLAIIFSFFFAVVSARMVGIIGVSNNPVSGMTIASLLIITSVFRAMGMVSNGGMVASLVIGTIVCVAISVAGGAIQNLKTTFIVGGTSKEVQYSMIIALLFTTFVAVGIMIILTSTYQIGSTDLQAPQATLIALLIKGIINAQLPWLFVLAGVFIAIACWFLRLPVLSVSLGIYLNITLTATIFLGGVIRELVERQFKENEKVKDEKVEKGILLSSGLIAGDALIGIIVAIFAFIGLKTDVFRDVITSLAAKSVITFLIFILLAAWMYFVTVRKTKKDNQQSEEN